MDSDTPAPMEPALPEVPGPAAELLEAAAASLRAGDTEEAIRTLHRATRALGIYAPGETPEDMNAALMEEDAPSLRAVKLHLFSTFHRKCMKEGFRREVAGPMAAQEMERRGFLQIPVEAWRAALARREWRRIETLDPRTNELADRIAERLDLTPEAAINMGVSFLALKIFPSAPFH